MPKAPTSASKARAGRAASLRPGPHGGTSKPSAGRKRQRSQAFTPASIDEEEIDELADDPLHDDEVPPPPTKQPGRKRQKTRAGSKPVAPEAPAKKKGKAKQTEPLPKVVEEPPKPVIPEVVKRVIKPLKGEINSIPEPPPRVRPSRTLFVWGNGNMGQLGLGTSELGEIARPRLHNWFESARKGQVLGLSPGAGIESIAVGGMHTLVIDEVGKIWSWGINDNAALGRPTEPIPSPTDPSQTLTIEDLETSPFVIQSLADEGFRAVQVAAGASISVALGEDGSLRAWGTFNSAGGHLGFDETSTSDKPKMQPKPVAIPSLSGQRFCQVVCGHDHVLALTTKGRVYAWGNGQQGQLGRRIVERHKHAALKPTPLKLSNIIKVATGHYHSFALDNKGRVWAWGINNYGQTGVSDEDYTTAGGENGAAPEELNCVWAPTIVGNLTPSSFPGSSTDEQENGKERKVVDIVASEHHSLFLLDDGSVWGCGRMDGHELGIDESHPAWEDLQERIEELREELKERLLSRLGKKRRGKGRSKSKSNKVKAKAKRKDEDAMDEDAVEGDGDVDMDGGDDNEESAEDSEDERIRAQANGRLMVDEFIPYPIPLLFPPPPTKENPDPPIDGKLGPLAENGPLEQKITDIECGLHFNLAVGDSGSVYSWGLGPSAELGLGPDTELAKTPKRVRSKALCATELTLEDGTVQQGSWVVEQVLAGGQHCNALARWQPEGAEASGPSVPNGTSATAA